jgi:hypothetical protein
MFHAASAAFTIRLLLRRRLGGRRLGRRGRLLGGTDGLQRQRHDGGAGERRHDSHGPSPRWAD